MIYQTHIYQRQYFCQSLSNTTIGITVRAYEQRLWIRIR